MNDAKLIKMLTNDLSTGGHWLGDEVPNWPDGELDGLTNILRHWWFQVSRELIRRGGTRPCENEREPDGELCTGTLTFEPGDLQAKCPICGGWTGRLAPPRTPTPAAEHQARLAAEPKETP